MTRTVYVLLAALLLAPAVGAQATTDRPEPQTGEPAQNSDAPRPVDEATFRAVFDPDAQRVKEDGSAKYVLVVKTRIEQDVKLELLRRGHDGWHAKLGADWLHLTPDARNLARLVVEPGPDAAPHAKFAVRVTSGTGESHLAIAKAHLVRSDEPRPVRPTETARPQPAYPDESATPVERIIVDPPMDELPEHRVIVDPPLDDDRRHLVVDPVLPDPTRWAPVYERPIILLVVMGDEATPVRIPGALLRAAVEHDAPRVFGRAWLLMELDLAEIRHYRMPHLTQDISTAATAPGATY